MKLRPLFKKMINLDIYPNFITVDGGEGGTGATFQELQDGVGLPLLLPLPIVTGVLERYDARKYMKIFASGKLITPDKIAIALGLGADLCNIARGMIYQHWLHYEPTMSFKYLPSWRRNNGS